MVIGIVAVSIWRVTFAVLACNERPPRLGLLALAISLGMLIGHYISFAGSISVPRPLQGPLQAELVRYGFGLLLSFCLVVFLSLFLHWVAAGASSWLERSGSRRRSHRFLIIGFITIASVFFSLWFGIFYIFLDAI